MAAPDRRGARGPLRGKEFLDVSVDLKNKEQVFEAEKFVLGESFAKGTQHLAGTAQGLSGVESQSVANRARGIINQAERFRTLDARSSFSEAATQSAFIDQSQRAELLSGLSGLNRKQIEQRTSQLQGLESKSKAIEEQRRKSALTRSGRRANILTR